MKENLNLISYYLKIRNKTDKDYPIRYDNQWINDKIDFQMFWDGLSMNQRIIILLGKNNKGFFEIMASSLTNSRNRDLRKAIILCQLKFKDLPIKLKYLLYGLLHSDLFMINANFFNYIKSINPNYPIQQINRYSNLIIQLNKVSVHQIMD